MGGGVLQIRHSGWQPTLELTCEQVRCLAETVSGDSYLLVFSLSAFQAISIKSA